MRFPEFIKKKSTLEVDFGFVGVDLDIGDLGIAKVALDLVTVELFNISFPPN